jgi:hypothetical protein
MAKHIFWVLIFIGFMSSSFLKAHAYSFEQTDFFTDGLNQEEIIHNLSITDAKIIVNTEIQNEGKKECESCDYIAGEIKKQNQKFNGTAKLISLSDGALIYSFTGISENLEEIKYEVLFDFKGTYKSSILASNKGALFKGYTLAIAETLLGLKSLSEEKAAIKTISTGAYEVSVVSGGVKKIQVQSIAEYPI